MSDKEFGQCLLFDQALPWQDKISKVQVLCFTCFSALSARGGPVHSSAVESRSLAKKLIGERDIKGN